MKRTSTSYSLWLYSITDPEPGGSPIFKKHTYIMEKKYTLARWGVRSVALLILFVLIGSLQSGKAQTYCTPSFTYVGGYNIGMAALTIGNMTNNTGTPNYLIPYNNYTNMKTTATANSTVSVYFQAGNSNSTKMAIYVDWNSNGVFAANELMLLSPQVNASATFNGSFVVPAAQAQGAYRMRVLGDLGSVTSIDPCLPAYTGEVEDYTFIVLGATVDIMTTQGVSYNSLNIGNNTISITAWNVSTSAINTMDIGYNINNGTPVVENLSAMGLASGGTFQKNFNVPLNISAPGTYTLKIWARNPNGTGAGLNGNDTVVKVLKACYPLSGNFTINPSGSGSTNYLTFTDAVTDLINCGVNGPVTFDVAAGTYTEQITIPAITGASTNNTITFNGGTGNAPTRTITHNTPTSGNQHVIRLNGASHVRIMNLSIISTGTSFGWPVHIMSNSTNVKVKHNVIQSWDYNTATGSTNFIPVCISGSTTSYSSGATNVYNLEVDSNTIRGGYFGISYYGNNANVYDIKTRNNVVSDFYYYGIYNISTNNVHFIRNIVTQRNSATTGGTGIYVSSVPANTSNLNEIIGNEITAFQYSIYLVSANNPLAPGKLYNNIGGLGLKNATSYGFYLSSSNNWNVWHNTIDMAFLTSGTNSACLYLTTAQGADVRNNIFSVSGVGSNALCIYTNSPTQQATINNNNYFKKGVDNQAPLFAYGTTMLSISTVKGNSGFNTVFANEEPQFVSSTDLRLRSTAASPFGDGSLNVTTDIDNNSRCTLFPTMGASESGFMGTSTVGIVVNDTLFTNSPVKILNTAAPGEPKRHTWDIDNGAATFNTLHADYTFTQPGIFDINLETVSCFATDNATKTVVVIDPVNPPVANFFSETNYADQGYPVRFFDQSTGGPSSWSWSVIPATGVQFVGSNQDQNPQIVFNQTGTYEVCLTASNAAGAGASLCKSAYIVVNEAISMCSNKTTTKSSSGKVFDSGGRDGVYGNSQSCDLLIDPCASSVTLSFTAFNLDQGDMLKVYDGVDESGTPIHTGSGFSGNIVPGDIVATTGKMFIRFVSNGTGNLSGFAASWTSVGKTFNKPVAAFRAPDTLYTGTTFTFVSSATGINPTIEWDFDNDGIVDATGLNPSYTFANAGAYIVRMTAQDCGGLDGAAKSILVINPTAAPTANFISDFTTIAPGQKVRFFDRSTQTPTTWSWTISPGTYSYSNGTNGSSQNPEVVFNAVGNYTITLLATNGFGNGSVTKTSFIKVVEYCFPGAGLNDDVGISRVTFGGIDNISQIGPETYSNFTQTVGSASLQKGGTYPITVERLTNHEDVTRKVWIDYNGDGIFSATELVASHTQNNSLIWTENVVVPSNISEGSTRMRVAIGYGATNNSACGVNPYGEFEDYTVTIYDNLVKPVITVIGQPVVSIEQGNSYTDDGATATDDIDGNLTSEIITTNNLNLNVVGTYYYRYNVSDNSGNSAEAERTIHVLPDQTAPVITLIGSNPETFYVGAVYTDPGATAADLFDGPLDPASIQVTGSVNGLAVGQYFLTYSVSDAAGNVANLVRTVNVVDTVAPEIILKGGDTVDLVLGATFTDPGAVVFDNLETGLPYNVDYSVIDNTVIGPYLLTYTAEDGNGNPAVPVYRVVMVRDVTAPVITLKGDTVVMKVHTSYKEPGYTVTDNYDPNIIVQVTGTVDTAQATTSVLVYTAWDASGNQAAFRIRIVRVIDDEAPVITMNGDAFMTICRWEDFSDPGVVVVDNLDGTLEAEIVNEVDANWVGMYTIRYSAIDNSGNRNSAERLVRVIDCMTGTENALENSLNVYPNPSAGTVHIESSGVEISGARIIVRDVLGRVITADVETTSANHLSLNLDAHPAGTYFISIQSEGQIVTRKIQIVK